MRLTLMRSGLPLFFVATMLCAEQTKPSSALQTSHPTAVKDSGTPSARINSTHKTQTHHQASTRRKASGRKDAKRAAYRPEYKQNSVEVMNGASTQKVVFQNDDAASQKDKAGQRYKVEVVNGTALDTQYFSGNNARMGSNEKHPVVIGVQSSDTRVAGGNKHPVVTGITMAGQVDAKSASSGRQNVTTGISPQPKRQAYQPDSN